MATSTDRIKTFLEEAKELGFLEAPRLVDEPEAGVHPMLEGETSVEGRGVTLRLRLFSSFPLTLPSFQLCPWDALGYIPHVLPESGIVCFLDAEGTVLNRRDPMQIIRESFELTMAVLRDGFTGRTQHHFADEFDVYWGLSPKVRVAPSVLEPGGGIRHVIVTVDRFDKEGLIWIAGCKNEISDYNNHAPAERFRIVQKALYLPLKQGAGFVPPRPDRPFWTAEEARDALLPHVAAADKVELPHLTKGRKHGTEYVIVELPRPSGGSSLFGIRYDGVRGPHPLRDRGWAKTLTPLRLRRLDRCYLIQRGGGDVTLSNKRVLLVGCGAIGGHIASELAQAGILDLTLIDVDDLSADNSFRHLLGRRYWGCNKAMALKEEVESQLPYVQVTAINQSIQHSLAAGSINLVDYDLMVLALGSPTIELDINQRLHTLVGAPPAVFTWLDPFGIGGHALLTNNADGGGCFECLYTPPDDGEETFLANRASFAGPNQSFGRALTGCGSLHTPYGSTDATQTAIMAARLALDVLIEKELGNPLQSWRGDATAFKAAGFALSHRYGFTDEQLASQRYTYQSPRCPICGPSSGKTR